MLHMTPSDEITTREALEILGLKDPASISRLVAESKLTPSRKLPGRTTTRLFWRADIEALATARATDGAA